LPEFFFILCLVSTAYLPSGLFDWWDKAQPVFAFLCLSGLGILAYQKAVVRAIIGLLIYGGLIGVLQWLTGWRSGGLADWVVDGIGMLITFTLIKALIKKGR